jgi:dipeptidyl aminopeptidase/acylaminoacyl peptidase
MSPVSHVQPDVPPTLLLHGGRDQLVPVAETQKLANDLNVFGVPHETVILPYAQHEFDSLFNGWGAQLARPIILQFLTHQLALGSENLNRLV